MTMEVLQNKTQITIARKDMIRRGLSYVDSPFRSLMRKSGFIRGITVGDSMKSWDVLSTVNFIESHVRKNEPVLDIGCFASELIVALHKLGYSNLTGIDLNPNLYIMPYQKHIRYEICDFMNTKFGDASFHAITSISVIEHGFNGPSLLKEISRLLKPHGYFIASFDYWPEKVDTKNKKVFGMDWKIFSRDEIVDFIADATNYNLFPIGKMMYEAKDQLVNWEGEKYTFAWIVIQKGN